MENSCPWHVFGLMPWERNTWEQGAGEHWSPHVFPSEGDVVVFSDKEVSSNASPKQTAG